jgi:hypothetical protein
MPRPDEDVVAILRDALAAAERGEITDLFLLYGLRGEYGSAYHTHDFDDLLLQIGSEHLYLKARQGRADDSRH